MQPEAVAPKRPWWDRQLIVLGLIIATGVGGWIARKTFGDAKVDGVVSVAVWVGAFLVISHLDQRIHALKREAEITRDRLRQLEGRAKIYTPDDLPIS